MLRSPTWTSYMETEKLQGATVDRISIKKFPSFRILVPSAAILEDFVSMSKFVLDQRNTLREQNRLFQEARDLLLPRLMDGRIPV
jgi:restriction endonuclease S subunit